ncbi:MAG: VanZ family protein [Desulfobacterales bacterium]
MSSIPDPHIGNGTPDYILHFLAYFLLTLLLIRLLLTLEPQSLFKIVSIVKPDGGTGSEDFHFWHSASLLGVLVAIVFGITDEIHQYFTPGRHCSFRDVLADSFGAFVAYGISMLDHRMMNRISFQHRWSNRIKWLKAISYTTHLSQKKSGT